MLLNQIREQLPAAAQGDLVNFLKNIRTFVIRVRHVWLVAYIRVKLTQQKNGIVGIQARTSVIQFFDGFQVFFIHRHEIIKLGQIIASQTPGAVGERQPVFERIFARSTVG